MQRVDHDVFWRQDSSSLPVEYVVTPMREGPEIVGAVLTFQDITERRLLEGQIVQAQKLESIGQLAAGIAHEINTPTQFINDNLCFLEDAVRDLMPLLDCVRVLVESDAEAGRDAARLEELAAAARQAELAYLLDEIPAAISQSLTGVGKVAKIVGSM